MEIYILFLVGFLVITAVHLWATATLEGPKPERSKQLVILSKPLLMPLLIAYYTIGNMEISWLIVVGLILGWVGDVALLKPKVEIRFIIGLGSFLLGHILYVIAFFQITDNLGLAPATIYISLIPFGLFLVFVMKLLKDDLKEMLPPVVVYMITILLMSFSALAIMLAPVTDRIGNSWLPFVGSLLFIASDFMLALKTFKKEFPYDQILIMATYIAAQFCIAQAFLG